MIKTYDTEFDKTFKIGIFSCDVGSVVCAGFFFNSWYSDGGG
jgi:hypothetical protein